jgi:hypothetical protein
MKKQKKTFTSIIITTITILIITNILLGAYDFVWHGLNRRKATQWYWYGYAYCPEFNTGYKTCLYNIRELQGAVEMYNMDNTPMMTELDLKRLLEEKYIKIIPTVNYSDCKYTSKGDLTDNGEICCELHGSMSEITQKYETEKREFDKKITIYNVSIRLIPAVLYFLYALISFAI